MKTADVDYARLDYEMGEHRRRWAARVEAEGLTCQECGGYGGEVDPVLDYGQGPWIECGWCEGTGKVTRHRRGMWLRCMKDKRRGIA
jgi:hypothetical protein